MFLTSLHGLRVGMVLILHPLGTQCVRSSLGEQRSWLAARMAEEGCSDAKPLEGNGCWA